MAGMNAKGDSAIAPSGVEGAKADLLLCENALRDGDALKCLFNLAEIFR